MGGAGHNVFGEWRPCVSSLSAHSRAAPAVGSVGQLSRKLRADWEILLGLLTLKGDTQRQFLFIYYVEYTFL